MGLYNNVPTFTYVSATGITVTYNEEIYTVQSFYTNKKYIYWDRDNATVLQASNTMPTRSFKRHLVLINDNGIVNEVPSTDENFSISYAGDSDEAIKTKIYALYESNKEFGDKFVAIEQDIDGIKQIVGSGGSGGSGNEVVDRVSKLEQTAEKIELSVEEVKKTYADDKEMNLLREELNTSIINLNTAIGTLSSEMSEYYKDDKITNEEKNSIENSIALITYNKSEMLKYVNKVILICESEGQNENLNTLNSGVTALENAHTNLVQNITVAISDSIITNSEKTVIIDGFAKYNLRINELKNTCDDIIFLGIGGILSEQLAQITMKSNEIKLSVHKVESSFTSELSLQKIELEGQIKDVSSSLGSFKDAVETTFKDGIIDEAEKKILSEKLDQLEKEKLDIDSQYDNVYNSEFLTEPYNQNLKIEYDNYCSKHLELKNKIVEVIGFGNVTDADHLNVKTLFNEYSSSLASLNVCLSNSLDIISTSKANAEILKAKGELIKELEEANSKIDDVINNIDDFIGDGVVDSAEKKAIELSLQNLEKEKVDVDAQYNYWYSNTYLVDPLKSNYKRSYDNYISKYNHSVSVIEGIINQEGLVSDQNKQDMLNAHRELATSLVAFVEKTNEVIEFVSLKQSEAIKNALQGDIDDINHKLQGLDDIVSGTFEDNIIDQTERKILTQNLLDLELQKTDVVNQYEQLYKSIYLDGTLKEAFRTSYNNFISKYNVLVDTINLILDKTDLVNDTDRENVSNAQSNLNIAFGDFVKKSNEVIEYISKKQSSESIRNFDSELKDLNNKVDNILSDVGGALSDDVLDKAERMILESSLNDLEIQKNDVVTQYENLFNNENLTDNTIKENLKNSYNDFISKYNVLVNQIRYLLDKSGNITEDNRTAYQTAYNEYKASATTFTENFYIANDFITNKVINDMKDSFNAEIRDVNDAINNLDETMNGIFKDGILSEAEKLSIKQQLVVLEREKLDVDNNHNNVYSNSNLSSSLKTNLKNAYDSYISSYNSLVSVINTILNKTGIISSSEQTVYKNALSEYKIALVSYSSVLRQAIDNITSNKIESTKADIEREIGDVISSINDLENNMNEIFKDGVLSEAEKTTIRQQLQILYKEKGDVDKQYTALYSNAFLVDSSTTNSKSELKTAYDNFVSKYNALVLVIDEILKKTTIVDDSDRTKLENALSAYRTASSNYTAKAMNAIDAISSKKAQDESNKVNEKYADIILGEDGIVNKVGKIEKVSSTNAEGLKKLTERVDKAELEIKPESIIATVSQSIKDAVDDVRNDIEYERKNLNERIDFEVKELNSSVNNVFDYIDGAYKDGILDENEKKILKNELSNLEKEKNDVIAQVDSIQLAEEIANTSELTYLINSKNAFISSHSDLVDQINSLLNVDSLNMKIHFIDTKVSGDCILIQYNGKNILIDSNEEEVADNIINYLKNNKVTKLDYIIATHHHSDHTGGMTKIINAFDVSGCIAYHRSIDFSKLPSYEVGWGTKDYHDKFVSICNSKGITLKTPTEKERLTLSSDTYLEFYNTNTSNYNNYNNFSICVLVYHQGKKYFLGGDIYTQSQTNILNSVMDVDVYKAQHHDYDYDMNEAFIDKLNPEKVIITNFKKHGNNQARAISGYCQFRGIPYYLCNGTIILTSNSNGYYLSTNIRTTYTNAWWDRNNTKNWYYFKANGSYAKNESLVIDNKTYNFDNTGLCTNPY